MYDFCGVSEISYYFKEIYGGEVKDVRTNIENLLAKKMLIEDSSNRVMIKTRLNNHSEEKKKMVNDLVYQWNTEKMKQFYIKQTPGTKSYLMKDEWKRLVDRVK